jgi:hypothetical protein
LQGFYDFLAILHGVILAEHAVFIGFYTFSRTTNLLRAKERLPTPAREDAGAPQLILAHMAPGTVPRRN